MGGHSLWRDQNPAKDKNRRNLGGHVVTKELRGGEEEKGKG